MFRFSVHIFLLFLVLLAGTVAWTAGNASGFAFPGPAVDAAKAAKSGEQTAVVAGGCFWGIQAVFQHVKGVKRVASGYSGGDAKTAEYEIVSTGETGHAESVKITYDPALVTYGALLGTCSSGRPRSHRTEPAGTRPWHPVSLGDFLRYEQKKIAEAYIAQLDKAKVFPRPVVTQVVPLKAFYPAEAYHQNYATLHPDDPYIVYNDAPKVAHLRQEFPELYTGK